MATNPRDQKLISGVAQVIKESLESSDSFFHMKNRGIAFSVKSCAYNNKTKEVTINFEHLSKIAKALEVTDIRELI